MFLQNGVLGDHRGHRDSGNNATCTEVMSGRMASHTKESAVTPTEIEGIMLINVLDIQGKNCHKLESRYHK